MERDDARGSADLRRFTQILNFADRPAHKGYPSPNGPAESTELAAARAEIQELTAELDGLATTSIGEMLQDAQMQLLESQRRELSLRVANEGLRLAIAEIRRQQCAESAEICVNLRRTAAEGEG